MRRDTRLAFCEGNLEAYRCEHEIVDVSTAREEEERKRGFVNGLVALVKAAGGGVNFNYSGLVGTTSDQLTLERHCLTIDGSEYFYGGIAAVGAYASPSGEVAGTFPLGAKLRVVSEQDSQGRRWVCALDYPNECAVVVSGRASAGSAALLLRYLRGFAWCAGASLVMAGLLGVLWGLVSSEGTDWLFALVMAGSLLFILSLLLLNMWWEDRPGGRQAERVFRALGWRDPEWINLDRLDASERKRRGVDVDDPARGIVLMYPASIRLSHRK